MKKQKSQKTTYLPISKRKRTFLEVSKGFSESAAIKESKRCLQCSQPSCISGCPASVQIPQFIKQIRTKNYSESLKIIKQTNMLPAICGRVCPQELQCEGACILAKQNNAIKIGHLERFAGDKETSVYFKEKTSTRRVAVIGSGPAGLTAAQFLAQRGCNVTVFETMELLGGITKYGIPEFRLPHRIIDNEIEKLMEIGIEFKNSTEIGNEISLDSLSKDFDAVLITSGAGTPNKLKIPGENLPGVISAMDFLFELNEKLPNNVKNPKKLRVKLGLGQNVVVIGAGNVAMDAARCAIRLGCRATIVYRKTEDEIPARAHEVTHAKEEGAKFKFLLNPVEIIPDKKGRVAKIKFEIMKSSDTEENISPTGKFKNIASDTVIVAIGQKPNYSALKGTVVATDGKNRIKINERCETSVPGIYAAGDCVIGSATVVQAIDQARKAALSICNYLAI
jgi:glutamate synthase (NADPH/NADH) small chain